MQGKVRSHKSIWKKLQYSSTQRGFRRGSIWNVYFFAKITSIYMTVFGEKNLYRDDCCQLLSCVNHTTPGLKAISQNGIGCCQNTWLSHLLYELVLTLSDLVRPKTVMLYVLAPKTYRNRLLGASGRKSPCAGAEWMPSAVCVPETLCLQIIVGRGVQIFSAPRWLSKTCNPRITHQHFIEVDQGT